MVRKKDRRGPPTIRCDNYRYLVDFTRTQGCVFPGYTPTFKLSRSRYLASARHVANAQTILGGLGAPGHAALHRTTLARLQRRNRSIAVAKCRALSPRPSGHDCDEYPFSSSREGCANTPNCSVRYIPSADNRGSGALLGAFFRHNRVHAGDAFRVHVVP